MSIRALRAALEAAASPVRAKSSASFFKTGEGQYSHGDKFMGITVPQQRVIVKQFRGLSLAEVLKLLKSDWHEERLTALLLMVEIFNRSKESKDKEAVVKTYLENLKWVNNWDLVDSSAHQILGAWLLDRDRSILYKLSKSKVLWERRVAMVATYRFILNGEHSDTLKLSKAFLNDQEDLMHKASGWMLREMGKRVGLEPLRGFLKAYAGEMPRTMLRYAIERLPLAERQRWMAAKA